MNYEEMSDHAISSKILESKVMEMGFTANIRPTLPHNAGSTNAYCGNTLENFDINNPADMWPIILESGISLINDKGFCYATNNCYETFEPHGLGVTDGYFYSKAGDKSKLLRAAAIVFLMMKDAEKAN